MAIALVKHRVKERLAGEIKRETLPDKKQILT
jgi:hypothetical protein